MRVLPKLPCATCAATVNLRVTMRDYGPGPQSIHVAGTFGGQPVDLGTKAVAAGQFATFTGKITVAHPQLWAPGSPNLYDLNLTASVGADPGTVVQTYLHRDGDPLDQGGRRPSVPQRPPAELPRRRPAGGQQGQGVRDRQLRSPAVHRRDQEARRDVHPLAVPAASGARGARRRERDHAVVRDPGLLDQDALPQAGVGAPARLQRAARQHPRQRQPPVDHHVVDRQRAQLAPRPGPELLHLARGRAGSQPRPDAPGGARGGRLPGCRLPSAVQAAGRHRLQRLLRLVPPARTARSPTARSSPTTSTRSTSAIRTRR